MVWAEHNLHLQGQLVRDARAAILEGRHAEFERSWLAVLSSGDAAS